MKSIEINNDELKQALDEIGDRQEPFKFFTKLLSEIISLNVFSSFIELII